MSNGNEWYPDVKVGERFTMPDGTPARKAPPDFQEMAQRQLDAVFTGLKIIRDPVDGRFIIDNKEEFIRQAKLKFPND